MTDLTQTLQQTATNGFAIIEDVFTENETSRIIEIIESSQTENPAFRKSGSLFAIRQFLKEVPGVKPYIFTEALMHIVNSVFGQDYFVVKSIYFDKPPQSNWFVAYHQDLTISVTEKHETEGFTNFTVKHNHYAVQPPAALLADNFTLRIHLDDTDEQNGALHVVPASHTKGIIPPGSIAAAAEQQTICPVKKGGVMIMKPLLLHASARTVNNRRRRVVHIELGRAQLPAPLTWSERELLF